ncbi:MAG TPA: methyltransferase domain-containing protein [Alphaproteobacteria bacterium]|nr:methyltransferase domain-containing protein [Alphaproteobacteria bacterium]
MANYVIDVRDFYATSLGQMAGRILRRRVRSIWPNVKGERICGIGYATPYLRPFQEQAERVVAVMPAGQGVLRWPPSGPNLAVLADDSELPLPDVSFDRVLLVHAVERTEALRPLLREVWRLLTDGGKMLVMVPNRRGIWARLEATPFGHGQPYTGAQLSRLLRDNLFTPLSTTTALFVPPLFRRLNVATAPAWERLGNRWFQGFGGVVMIEATKQIYAVAPAARARARRPIYVVAGREASTHRAPRSLLD